MSLACNLANCLYAKLTITILLIIDITALKKKTKIRLIANIKKKLSVFEEKFKKSNR